MKIQRNIRVRINILLITCIITVHNSFSQSVGNEAKLDVINYHVQLKPNIIDKYIEGNVIITFIINPSTLEVVFDCGNLQIKEIKGNKIESYKQKNKTVIISLAERVSFENEIQIFYEGTPTRGVEFFSEPQQMYTAFSTSEWMICNSVPSDRAFIKIDLLIDSNFGSIASGMLTNKKSVEGNMTMHSWSQDYATPAYTYGFFIGSTFKETSEHYSGIAFNYYSHNSSIEELKRIFGDTNDMLLFFEEKSGHPYMQKSYSQILIGKHYQEMSGYSILKESYGNLVLRDSTETNLISHELAHQWWGNMITCENWEHFWLNEGFATFMSAAYNEHRFGKAKYLSNIDVYHKVYENIKSKGADKSLVFESWSNPTSDDRNLVYFKGAYVLHMLREELGDLAFWKGIKYFSLMYYGKSVTTQNLQDAMEESSQQSLTKFFNTWVYNK